MTKEIRLSIIIVHYKTRDFTIQCLESIRAFGPQMAYELIVVDNDSKDGIGGIIAKYFSEVRLINTGRNTGFSYANNLGIRHVHGEYMLFLNSDTKIIEPVFERLVEFMDSNPDVGAIGPRHLWQDGCFQVSYGKFPTLWSEISRKYKQHKIISESDVDWLSASCLLVRRRAFEDSGPFDEAIFMYFEDVDLCTRMRNKGWRIRYYPQVAIIHYGGQSVDKDVLKGCFENRCSQLYFAGKYYGKAGEMATRAFLFIRFLIIGIGSVLEFCFFRIFRKDDQVAYMRMILSCKVISMAILLKAAKPVEPV